ncbi:hypothetical protein FJV46_10550 [Arthrobacter agilis]|uniref:hypothetical protein n=1 Tax=Arthrobacter agilis TaxID=37921 RepID=UPI000B361986|nr:hypothetical protein [Arthrobacter agilis]OUM44184.1 hypothetical protein B8W74_04730 [Arthrobacter agilis]PPB46559.1 hypothetical protein CI784_07025 [Arthrobacter agilis]TPV23784.1 hypothetical protein FJV46_10550 [Arthrobacter agilis]VDR32515.1 Uncharacterised protein [Arthrobacter agilis]
MSGARRRAVAYVHPTGCRPYRDPAHLHYRDNAELKAQLTQYARSKWTTATRIDIDLGTRQILINGTVAAGFAITEPRPTADQEGLPL